jgi:hypothetical protein
MNKKKKCDVCGEYYANMKEHAKSKIHTLMLKSLELEKEEEKEEETILSGEETILSEEEKDEETVLSEEEKEEGYSDSVSTGGAVPTREVCRARVMAVEFPEVEQEQEEETPKESLEKCEVCGETNIDDFFEHKKDSAKHNLCLKLQRKELEKQMCKTCFKMENDCICKGSYNVFGTNLLIDPYSRTIYAKVNNGRVTKVTEKDIKKINQTGYGLWHVDVAKRSEMNFPSREEIFDILKKSQKYREKNGQVEFSQIQPNLSLEKKVKLDKIIYEIQKNEPGLEQLTKLLDDYNKKLQQKFKKARCGSELVELLNSEFQKKEAKPCFCVNTNTLKDFYKEKIKDDFMLEYPEFKDIFSDHFSTKYSVGKTEDKKHNITYCPGVVKLNTY